MREVRKKHWIPLEDKNGQLKKAEKKRSDAGAASSPSSLTSEDRVKRAQKRHAEIRNSILEKKNKGKIEILPDRTLAGRRRRVIASTAPGSVLETGKKRKAPRERNARENDRSGGKGGTITFTLSKEGGKEARQHDGDC